MKYATGLLAVATTCAFASPVLERDDAQTVHLVFHGEDSSYEIAFPADGTVYPTNSNVTVSTIDDNDYNASVNCHFVTDSEVKYSQKTKSNGEQYLVVSPAATIKSVSCQGTCISVYGDCYGTDGQFIGPCCNGYCAADKCRPWTLDSPS